MEFYFKNICLTAQLLLRISCQLLVSPEPDCPDFCFPFSALAMDNHLATINIIKIYEHNK